jgi:hypothetical protein
VPKESKGRTKGAFIIKATNVRSAKEVLQLMRTSINLQEIGVSVKGLARNDSGEIKIDVQEAKGRRTDVFQESDRELRKRQGRDSMAQAQKTITLRDVDNVVSEEEIYARPSVQRRVTKSVR